MPSSKLVLPRKALDGELLSERRIKVPLGREIGLGPGHVMLDGDPPPLPKRAQPPNFWSMSIVVKRSPISATAEHLYKRSRKNVYDALLLLPLLLPLTVRLHTRRQMHSGWVSHVSGG